MKSDKVFTMTHREKSKRGAILEKGTMGKCVKLAYDDGKASVELPLVDSSLGPSGIDIRELAKTGLFAFDPGFMSTASCESKITYVDGTTGHLYYRGYPIEAVVHGGTDYLETCYLLIYGDLPQADQKARFVETIMRHTMVHDQLSRFFTGFRRDAHPMAMMLGVVGALSAFYQDSLDVNDPRHREVAIFRLIAKVPTLAAMCYRYTQGLPFNFPRNHLSYAANILFMLFAVPCEEYTPDPVCVRALDRILVLHADHEQNASTSTMRLVGSSGANPFACVAAAIACLWGPAHGGANEAVLNMLDAIGDISEIDAYISRVKSKNTPIRLMGFGHRVYKTKDPRAEIMRQTCDEVLHAKGLHDHPRFRLAKQLEKTALADPYFIERHLYPNVDFYSGIILSAIGIPKSMFTVIFALARTVGWISHWNEMISDPKQKIARPRQLYTGNPARQYIKMEDRAKFLKTA